METELDCKKLNLNRKSGEPLHLQLYHSLVREIRSLSPNRHVSLMSERELALQLKLSRRTTRRAYEHLLDDHLVRRMSNKSLVVRSDARTRIKGAYPVIGILVAMDVAELMERNDRSILPYLEGLIGRCSKRNVSCLMLNVPGRDASPEKIEEFAAEHFPRLCGLIHLGGLDEKNEDPILEQILRHTEIPQVCISGSVPNADTGLVYADPVSGLDELCRTLKERGYRSAGVLGPQFTPCLFHYTAMDRSAAMEAALKRNGLECRYVHLPSTKIQKEHVTEILTAPKRPEVLLCHNDQIAHLVMEEAARLGISIPDDLALVGFDCQQKDPFLASIQTFQRQIAENAIDMVMELFENGISTRNRVKVLATSFSDGPSLKMGKCSSEHPIQP